METDGKDFDDAVAIGEEIERQIADLASAVTPIGIELILANMLIAFFFPAVWIIVALFYVTACAAGISRSDAKAALKAHRMADAKAAIASAKNWTICMSLTQAAMAGVEIWAFFRLLAYFKGSFE